MCGQHMLGLFIQSMLVGAAADCCMRLRVGSRDQSHTVCSCVPFRVMPTRYKIT